MELWFSILISVAVAFLLKSISNLLSTTASKLPPEPFTIPIISNIRWLLTSFSEIEPILRSLHTRLGPIVTLRIGSRPAIFIADRTLAHQALIQNGAVFADRPPPLPTSKIITSNQHNISSAAYGPTWRKLRRNLTAEILHPSRVKSYAHAREWVLQIIVDRINQTEQGKPVRFVDHIHYAMFGLLALMCFGDKLNEKQIKEIESAQRNLLLSFGKFNILNFWPKVTKLVFRKRWEQLLKLREDQEKVLIPLVRARKEKSTRNQPESESESENYVLAYVDTLLDLDLPEENRKLAEQEIVTICSEFLNAGTDTTSTALQWIMANLVKHQNIQQTLFAEIKNVIGDQELPNDVVQEEDLAKMPYLKAVVLEGLRRHPPGHFVLPHSVTVDTELGGFVVPKNGTVNFMVAEFGWDPEVWEDPMAFKPERFMGEEGKQVDITGSREIKMAPFGVGRRICPGLVLALHHLEYYVANLVWKFEWKAVDGDVVDLSEKQEFTMVMKYPLQAIVSPRRV